MIETQLSVGEPIIFMKVGVHAREPLDEILVRKRKEILDEGFAMWGYGGNTCHPNRVREFAEGESGRVSLVMQEITSNHWEDQIRATGYSADGGRSWLEVPAGINVLGSRYALCLGEIEDADFSLDLATTRVATGPSLGKPGNDYVRQRVDKACLRVSAPGGEEGVHISFVAPLVPPYAVVLRD